MTNTYSTHTPQQALLALLELNKPQHLLVVGSAEWPALTAFLEAHHETQTTQITADIPPEALPKQRFDFAVVIDCLENLPKQTGKQLLGIIRNLNTNRMAVLVDLQAAQWQETEFYALALEVAERFQRDDQVLHLFTYDLHDYKQVPDWLNAQFWANPQLFGKYWW